MKHPPRKPKPERPVAGAGSAAAVDFAAIERAVAALPPAPPANTRRSQVERLREALLDAMANRSQSPEALAELLAGLGIAIRPATLRRYLGPITERRRRAAPTTTSAATPAARPHAGQPATGGPSPARAVPVREAGREADPGAWPGARAAAAPDRSEAVLAAAPTPAPASPASAHSHLNLTSRFVPAPELPYDELIRQAEARKAQEAQ